MVKYSMAKNNGMCPSEKHDKSECAKMMLPVQDALAILSGKWKLPILIALSFGSRRFRQIAAEIPGITDKMLSKELKDLEENHLITRKVHDTFPPAVEYAMTPHGRSINKLLNELRDWGVKHRKRVFEER